MTDKQIIIDGVDVSGCRAYYKEYDITDMCSLADGLTCKENPNCYYKQLKRKEQECDMWKNLTVDNGAVALKYQQQIDQLKAENKHLNDLLNQALKDYDKAVQTLTEIKEICNNNDELKGDFNLVDCDKYKLGKHNLANKILQKISEVEE